MKRRILGYGLLLLLLVEVALQVVYYASVGAPLFARTALPLYVAHEDAGFWNRPGLDLRHETSEFSARVITNAQGLRVPSPDIEYATTPDPSTYRVLLLGPSFAFGWGVDWEDSFAAHLEAALEARGFGDGRDIEIVNAGVPALPSVRQLDWFEARGRDFRPDLVVQLIYGSLVVSTRRGTVEVDDDGYLRPKARRFTSWLKRSAIVFYGWLLYTRLRATPTDRIEGAGRPLTVHDAFDPDGSAVEKSMAYYDRLSSLVRASGARLVVVHFPLSYCVHQEDIARWEHLGVRDVDGQIAWQAAFCDHLSALGLECVNLTSALRSAAGERLYYWLDIHWTPAGNRVAAEALAERL